MVTSEKPSKHSSAERETKLAEALRANLRRRKAGVAAKAAALPKPKTVDET